MGPYTNIIDFLYEIENDEELNFEIQKMQMEQYTVKKITTYTDIENPENNKTESEYPLSSTTNISSSSVVKSSNSEQQDDKSETVYSPKWIRTKFIVEDIGITLD